MGWLSNLSNNKKQKKRMVLEENKINGRFSENKFRILSAAQGHRTERTGRGHDFKVIEENPLTGRRKSYFVEVKSSKTAPLSRLQKKNVFKGKVRKVVVDSLF